MPLIIITTMSSTNKVALVSVSNSDLFNLPAAAKRTEKFLDTVTSQIYDLEQLSHEGIREVIVNIMNDVFVTSAAKTSKKRTLSSTDPKPPKTAYLQWYIDNQASVAKDFPELKCKELGRKCGEMWRELDEATKQVYRDRYEEERKTAGLPPSKKART